MAGIARLALGAGVAITILSAPLPASAAGPGLGLDVVSARDTWRAAGAAVRDAAAELAAAEAHHRETRAVAAEALAVRDREHGRLAAARAVLDAARRQVEAAGGERTAAAKGPVEHGGPVEIPSGGSLGRGGQAAGAAADLAERHELLQALTGAEPADPAQARAQEQELAEAVRARDRVAAAHAGQGAVHAAAAAAAEALAADAAEAETALALAQQALEARIAEHVESLAGLRGLGWRAGVPGRHGWVWPTDGAPGSGFGPRRHPISGRHRLHAGVDVPAPTGQPVVAAAAGTVTFAGMHGGYGFTVDVDHGEGRMTRYSHLSYIHVREGERVEQSQRIGKVGSTGASTGSHLHWEVHVDGRPRDPLGSFPGA